MTKKNRPCTKCGGIDGKDDIDRISEEIHHGYSVLEVQVFLEHMRAEHPKTYKQFKYKYPTIGCVKV